MSSLPLRVIFVNVLTRGLDSTRSFVRPRVFGPPSLLTYLKTSRGSVVRRTKIRRHLFDNTGCLLPPPEQKSYRTVVRPSRWLVLIRGDDKKISSNTESAKKGKLLQTFLVLVTETIISIWTSFKFFLWLSEFVDEAYLRVITNC